MSDRIRAKLFKKLRVGGSLAIWQLKGEADRSPFFFHAGLKVDADGAPNAYCPIGAKGGPGLDRLGNAGKNGNWWGVYVEKSTGQPYVQPSGPYEGCYVSSTGLVRAGKKDWDPDRYVDATKVPYIALAGTKLAATGLQKGDYCFVINASKGRGCGAIYGDWKEKTTGEGSMFLAKELGINSNPKNGGTSKGIIYIVFPGSGAGNGIIPAGDVAMSKGHAKFLAWAGAKQLAAGFPEYKSLTRTLSTIITGVDHGADNLQTRNGGEPAVY